MKVKDIVNIYQQQNELDSALIVKVLDSIKDFGRKLTLRSQYKPIKSIADDYEDERIKIVKKLLIEYCNELNEKNKDIDDWTPIVPEQFPQIPQLYMHKFIKENEDILNANVEIKSPIKFSLKEIKNSAITFSEIEILENFIDFDTELPEESI